MNHEVQPPKVLCRAGLRNHFKPVYTPLYTGSRESDAGIQLLGCTYIDTERLESAVQHFRTPHNLKTFALIFSLQIASDLPLDYQDHLV